MITAIPRMRNPAAQIPHFTHSKSGPKDGTLRRNLNIHTGISWIWGFIESGIQGGVVIIHLAYA
jgi:hypothetical protein